MGLFDFLGKGKEKAAEQEAKAKALLEAAPVGSSGISFGSQFTCATFFPIAPKPLDVGVKRSRELENRIVVSGSVKGGEFEKGDAVVVLGSDGVVKAVTKLLDLIPDDGSVDFFTELCANMHKKKAALGAAAWLILDVTGGVDAGDMIAKL